MAERHGHGDARSRAGSRSVAKAAMTLEEALRIEQQYERGVLDLSLPGTDAVLADAHRVRLKAQLWGADRTDVRRRQARGTVLVVSVFIVVTIVGLVACFSVTV